MTEIAATAEGLPSQPTRPTVLRTSDFAGPNEDTETIQVPKFAGNIGVGVKLFTYVGLPVALVIVGIVGVCVVYRDIFKPWAVEKIAQDKSVTEHTIVATEKMKNDGGKMAEMVTEQRLTNQHLESLGKSHEKMWQVMERMDRSSRVRSHIDEQGRIEIVEPGPPGTIQ